MLVEVGTRWAWHYVSRNVNAVGVALCHYRQEKAGTRWVWHFVIRDKENA